MTTAVDAVASDVLSGDWWFIRRQTIPHTAARVEYNRKAFEGRKSARRSTWETRQRLGDLSDKAARLCARQLTTLLAGVNRWLHELQATEVGHEPISGKNLTALRKRLDIPEGKPWSRRLIHAGTEYWTPDLAFKLAILRRQTDASPDILDWAMHHTYLVQSQGELTSGTIPLDVVIYCACALEFCTHFKPLEIRRLTLGPSQVEPPTLSSLSWQSNAIDTLRRYRNRTIALLSQRQLRELDYLLDREPDAVFATAERVSKTLGAQLREWGVTL